MGTYPLHMRPGGMLRAGPARCNPQRIFSHFDFSIVIVRYFCARAVIFRAKPFGFSFVSKIQIWVPHKLRAVMHFSLNKKIISFLKLVSDDDASVI